MPKKIKSKPTEREKIVSFIEAYAPDEKDKILLADGLDKAFMGLMSHNSRIVAVYSRSDCVRELSRKNDWSWEEAEEFFSFNVEGAYVGSHTPVFIQKYCQ